MANSEQLRKQNEVFNLRNKRFLFVGINEHQIRYAFEVFDFNTEEWGAITWGASLHGRGFERIALMHPGRPLSNKEEQWYQELRCRLINPESFLRLI